MGSIFILGYKKRFVDNKMNDENIEFLSQTLIELISKTKNEITQILSNLYGNNKTKSTVQSTCR